MCINERYCGPIVISFANVHDETIRDYCIVARRSYGGGKLLILTFLYFTARFTANNSEQILILSFLFAEKTYE